MSLPPRPRWTRTQRRKLHGIRRPHRHDPPNALLRPGEAWAWLRRRHALCVERGEALVVLRDVPTEPIVGALGDLIQASPPDQLDLQREQCRMAIALWEGRDHAAHQPLAMRALLRVWVDRGGAEFVARLACAPAALVCIRQGRGSWALAPLQPKSDHERVPVCVRDGSDMAGKTGFELHFWHALRAWLMLAPKPTFERARALAAPCRDRLIQRFDAQGWASLADATTFSGLSFAFARDPSWAEEDVYATLAGVRKGLALPWLMASMTDPRLALALAEHGPFGYAMPFEPYLYDIIEALGGHAADVIEALMDRDPHLPARTRRRFLDALQLAKTAPLPQQP